MAFVLDGRKGNRDMNKENIEQWTREAGGFDATPEFLAKFAALVASAEREEIAQMIEDAPALMEFAQNDQGGCLMCGFTPKLAAKTIRARGNVATNDTSQERVDKTSENVHDPVAWISATELLVMRGNALGGAKDWRVNLGLEPEEGDVGLYTAPPQRTWVGLTDEEIRKWWASENGLENCDMCKIDDFVMVARAIEAKLKEKNT